MKIKGAEVRCFRIPTATDFEADGTVTWSATELVTVELKTDHEVGLGYTYADESTARFISTHGLRHVIGHDVFKHHLLTQEIKKACRNLGNGGVNSMALSAVDTALWDLRARTLHCSFQDLVGKKRHSTPFYGSGLFINNSLEDLRSQMESWRALGLKTFKMKIGSGIGEDLRRVKLVREFMDPQEELYVDANGFYQVKEALALAQALVPYKVSWFEEPITTDDTRGMAYLKEHFPPEINYVAGEYANQITDFLRLLDNKLVDIMQVDATRSEGVTGALAGSLLAHAYNIPVSTHCAPLLHGNLGVCLDHFMIGECFFDHQRIEERLFGHQGRFENGAYVPAEKQKGFGWELRKNQREHLIYEHIT